jgi:pyridoxamine 5'-phosphate oxidase-like protein
MSELAPAESMRLLGSVPLGRAVFTMNALPAVRPVTHIVEEGAVVFRPQGDGFMGAVAHAAGDVVVAYQADSIDAATRLGWSVVITEIAGLITDPGWRSGRADDQGWGWLPGEGSAVPGQG